MMDLLSRSVCIFDYVRVTPALGKGAESVRDAFETAALGELGSGSWLLQLLLSMFAGVAVRVKWRTVWPQSRHYGGF